MLQDSVGLKNGLKPWGDPYHMRPGQGYQINWDRVSDFFTGGKGTVKLNGAAVVGADSLTVDALERGLRAGETLRGPDVETVVVTVVGAHAQGATTLNVTAITGALPDNAVLDFGGDEFARVNGDHAEGDATITIDALPIALEGGETATFQGGEHNIEVIEDVEAGATTVAIANLQYALADNTELISQRSGVSNGDKFIPEATVMALDTTTTPTSMIPRRDATTEEAFGFITSHATNSRGIGASHSRSGYGTIVGNTFIYENLLPDADAAGNLPADFKAELIANADFYASSFVDYYDSRA